MTRIDLTTICNVEGCEKGRHRGRMCSMHAERLRRTGTTDDPVRQPLWDRFWSKVDARGICWEWTGSTNHLGYGHILTAGRKLGMAHRVAWELLVGPIGDGLELDHLCRNPGCVNPDHLEPVTHAENMRRAPWDAAQFQLAKKCCPQGHPYSGDNLIIRTGKKSGRLCRICKNASERDRRKARKQAAA